METMIETSNFKSTAKSSNLQFARVQKQPLLKGGENICLFWFCISQKSCKLSYLILFYEKGFSQYVFRCFKEEEMNSLIIDIGDQGAYMTFQCIEFLLC